MQFPQPKRALIIIQSMLFLVCTVILPTSHEVKAITTPSITINEFSSHSSPEWVELYNQSDTKIDISGWSVNFNDLSINQRHTFPNGTHIVPGGWLIVEASRKLRNSGDTILLLDQSDTIIDIISYDSSVDLAKSVSFGRQTDGSADWKIFSTPTPGNSNVPLVSNNDESTPTLGSLTVLVNFCTYVENLTDSTTCQPFADHEVDEFEVEITFESVAESKPLSNMNESAKKLMIQDLKQGNYEVCAPLLNDFTLQQADPCMPVDVSESESEIHFNYFSIQQSHQPPVPTPTPTPDPSPTPSPTPNPTPEQTLQSIFASQTIDKKEDTSIPLQKLALLPIQDDQSKESAKVLGQSDEAQQSPLTNITELPGTGVQATELHLCLSLLIGAVVTLQRKFL